MEFLSALVYASFPFSLKRSLIKICLEKECHPASLDASLPVPKIHISFAICPIYWFMKNDFVIVTQITLHTHREQNKEFDMHLIQII